MRNQRQQILAVEKAMTIRLRQASNKDLPQLQELLEQSVRGLSRGYYTASEIEGSLMKILGVDSQLISDQTYYVAEVPNKIIGCGGWSKRKRLFGGDQFKAGEAPKLYLKTDAAKVSAFFVHPAYARRGVGRTLLNVCEAKAIEAGFGRAELFATLPGSPFYAALGYVEKDTITIDLGDGRSIKAIQMTKAIA